MHTLNDSPTSWGKVTQRTYAMIRYVRFMNVYRQFTVFFVLSRLPKEPHMLTHAPRADSTCRCAQ